MQLIIMHVQTVYLN